VELQVFVGDQVLPVSQAGVSVFDAGFQSGDAVWEGLRVYRGQVYALDEHLTRLEHSAKALRITLPFDRHRIADAIVDTLAANGFTDGVHVRLMVTRGTRSTSGMDPHNAPTHGTLVIIAEPKPVDELPTPQRLRTASTRRPQPHFVDPSIHHSNQLNSILARLEVMDDPDVDAALMLDTDGFVAEADTANIFCVTAGVVRTPLPTACLHGLTRATVVRLSRELSLPTEESRLTLFDLYSADEVFLTGTVCELVPVVEIDRRPIGSGAPGPVHAKLLAAYRDLVARSVDAASR